MIMGMIRVTWLLNCCHRRVSQTYCKARGLWRWVVGVMMVAVAVRCGYGCGRDCVRDCARIVVGTVDTH